MDKPFAYILDTSAYDLKYGGYGYGGFGGYGKHGANKTQPTIEGCISDTANTFTTTVVTQDIFTQMLTKITTGGKSSVICYKNIVNVVMQTICIWYPQYINTNTVSLILGVLDSSNSVVVEYIEDTGYKFSSANIKKLNSVGILMLDKLDSMTLSEFYSLFDNKTFIDKINKDWNTQDPDRTHAVNKLDITDPKIDDTHKIYPQYTFLKKIISKYKIVLDKLIWGKMLKFITFTLNYRNVISIRSLLNMHKVFISLGAPTNIEFIENSALFIEFDTTPNEKNIYWFNQILSYYPDINFTRRKIMDMVEKNIGNFVMQNILDSNYCSYSPISDIYYWCEAYMLGNKTGGLSTYMLTIKNFMTDYKDLFMHLISLGLIHIDWVKHYIKTYPDCGWDDYDFICKTISFSTDNSIIQMYVDNKLVVDNTLIEKIHKYETISGLYENSNSYTDSAFKRIIELSNDKSKLALNNHDFTPELESNIYEILQSLSERDRHILSNIIVNQGNAYNNYKKAITSIANILKYDIQITKKYLEYIFVTGNAGSIITLLHISEKYYYVIDYIDIDMVLTVSGYLHRLWFYNNILVPKLCNEKNIWTFCSFKDSDKYLFDFQKYESQKENAKYLQDLVQTNYDTKPYEDISKSFNALVRLKQENSMNRIISAKK